MQMPKPASPLTAASPASSQAAIAPGANSLMASSTPFAALLESHQPEPRTQVTKRAPTEASKDLPVTQADTVKPKGSEAASKGVVSDRSVDRQNERNRMNAQREARQLANRSSQVVKAPAPTQAEKAPTPSAPESKRDIDAEKSDKTPQDATLNPLALLQWLSDPSAPKSAGTEAAAFAAALPPADDEEGTAIGQEQAAPAGVRSVFSTIKAAGDHPASIAALPWAEKAPGAWTGLASKLHATSGLLAKAAQGSAVAEQKADPSVIASAFQSQPQAQMTSMGLDGWAKAVGDASSQATAGTPSPVHKTLSAATVDVNTAPQTFAIGPKSSAVENSAATSANLPAPVQSPEFRELLGQQISLWAKDGVQAAELHLNPAEMGPVSVQITLDGTQARVDFGADSAQTRQFIEAGLPELASALQDAGFTLSGGGVSQHARGREDQPEMNGAGSRRTDADASIDSMPPVTTSARRVALGGVDVYA